MPSRRPTPPTADQSWRKRAACQGHDPELWFPPPPNPYSTRKDRRAATERRMRQEAEAKAICRTCPVVAQCYAWAIATDADGVWGGTTETERGKKPVR